MSKIGLPVPPGFSITYRHALRIRQPAMYGPAVVLDEIDSAMQDLEERMGKVR